MEGRFDAVIAGAGPAGSSAAILLARAGWSVALVEKSVFPRRKVCGECIAASNMPLLDALGIGREVAAAAGPPLRRVALMQRERAVYADLPAYDDDAHPWGRALGREILDSLLLAQAKSAGASVLQPWSLRTVQGTAGNYRLAVEAQDGMPATEVLTKALQPRRTVLHTPVFIDAHGSWEALADERGRSRQPGHGARRGGELLAFKANYSGATLDAGLLPVLSFTGGYGGMVLADRGMLTLACCMRRDRLASLRRSMPGVSAGEAVGFLLGEECAGVAAVLRGARRCGPWLASGPLHPGIRVHGHAGGLPIGNAAGEAHPIIGEGLSMALQSGWMLCSRLVQTRPSGHADGQALVHWLRTLHREYAAEWRRQFTPRLRLAAIYAHLAMRPTVSAPLLPLLARLPSLIRRGAEWSGKVRCAVG